MKNDERMGESKDSAGNVNQKLAMDILSDNKNFLLSPNIEAYAGALTEEEKATRDLLIADAYAMAMAQGLRLGEKLAWAILAGEDPDSPYARRMVRTIAELGARMAELEKYKRAA